MSDIQVLNNGEDLGVMRGKINSSLDSLNTTKAETTAVLPIADAATKVELAELSIAWEQQYNPQSISGDIFSRLNHTGSQLPNSITQDADNRFVSDVEKDSWNSKEPAIAVKGSAFNKDFGSVANTISEGDHGHSGYEPASSSIQEHITNESGNPHGTTAAMVAAEPANPAILQHINNISNPHKVTKAQVKLGKVNNTADLDKPVSSPQSVALALKRDLVENRFGTPNEANYSEFDEYGRLKQLSADNKYPWRSIFIPATAMHMYNSATRDTGAQGAIILNATQTCSLSTFFQIPKDAKADQKMKMYLHWARTDSAAGTIYRSSACSWYDLASLYQYVSPSPWDIPLDLTMAVRDTYFATIEITDIPIYKVGYFEFTRSGANAGDTYPGNMLVFGLSFNYLADTLGSYEEMSK